MMKLLIVSLRMKFEFHPELLNFVNERRYCGKQYENKRKMFRVNSPGCESRVEVGSGNEPSENVTCQVNPSWYEYNGEISIGNPAQKFKVTFVTSTSETWVISSRCQSKNCRQHNFYRANESSTYQADGTSLNFTYGCGTVSGIVSIDDFAIGQLNIKNHPFVEIVHEEMNFSGSQLSMGLGYPYDQDTNLVPALEQLVEQKQIDALIYSLYFAREANKSSELVLGGFDRDHYEGKITYVPILKRGALSIVVDRITVAENNNTNNNTNNNNNGITLNQKRTRFILETGAFQVGLPKNIFDKVNKAIGAQRSVSGSYKVRCENVKSLPIISFSIGGRDFPLTSEDYIMPYKSRCWTNFYETENPGGVLGRIFFKRYLGVFDRERHRVGFAKAV